MNYYLSDNFANFFTMFQLFVVLKELEIIISFLNFNVNYLM